ncbi:VanZ family protein [Acetobacterium tundrae]|nr:VanZ family protein [Acetobacterium tundrae]
MMTHREEGRKVTRNMVAAWILVVFWMGLIFCFSNQPADQSDELSSCIAKLTIGSLGFNVDIGYLDFYVRKSAHFCIYLILAVLTLVALKQSNVSKAEVKVFIICVLYACSDEVHQLFILGRSGQVRDVFIDSTGVALGLLLYILLHELMMRRKARMAKKTELSEWPSNKGD